MKSFCISAVAVAAMLGLADSQGDQAKKDLDKMQGTWRVVHQTSDGKVAADKDIKDVDIKLIVKGTQYTVLLAGKQYTEGKLKIDASKSPREIDIMDGDGPFKGQTRPCIYKFDGDDMVVNYSPPGQPRPTEFTSKEGSKHLLIGYKRVK